MKKQVKYFKNVLGASLMEVIFVLGIMAVLTPVVMKYAFKDLADIKYLNLAKQLKQLIKTLSAYASSERDNWTAVSGKITQTDLEKYGLVDAIDKNIFDNLSMKYVKGSDSAFALYGVIDMSSLNLDAVALNKTLLYVGDHIGYVVNNEKCGTCASSWCVCAVNGNWGVDYSEVVVSDGESEEPSHTSFAVVRIDDALLEDEYDSTIYLYRNRNDSDLNKMGRDFYLGSDNLHMNDVREVKSVYAQTISGLADTGSASIDELQLLKSKEGSVSGNIKVNGSIYFKEVSEPTFSFSSAKIYVPKIIFEKIVNLSKLDFSNAYLLNGDMGIKPKLIAKVTNFDSIDLQNLIVKTLESGNNLDVYGFDDSNGLGILNDEMNKQQSRLHVKVPNVNVKNLNAKIININNHFMQSDGGGVSFKNGVIFFSSSSAPTVNLYDIKGNPSIRSVWSLMDKFEAGVTSIANKI